MSPPPQIERKQRGSSFLQWYRVAHNPWTGGVTNSTTPRSVPRPSVWAARETCALVSLHHFNFVAEHLLGPFDQLTGLAAIVEYLDVGIEAAKQPH